MEIEEIKQNVLEHKLAAALVLILAVFVLGAGTLVANTLTGGLSASGGVAEYKTSDSYRAETDLGSDIGAPPVPGEDETSGSYVEVQEGDIHINSEDIEKDISEITNLTQSFNGYVERSSKEKGELYNSADITVRVPSDSFQSYVSRMKKNFNVESYNVRNYRVSTQREIDELAILNKSFSDYEEIRKEVRKMDNNEKKLDLLMKITDKELELQERRKRYQRELSDKQQRGNLATIDINLEEKRKVDLMPDNIGNKVKNEVREMLETVVDTLIATFTGGVEILFRTIQYLVYLGIIAVPVLLAYKFTRRKYGEYF